MNADTAKNHRALSPREHRRQRGRNTAKQTTVGARRSRLWGREFKEGKTQTASMEEMAHGKTIHQDARRPNSYALQVESAK